MAPLTACYGNSRLVKRMDLNELLREIVAFRDARDWKQFHSVNHLASAISIESAELQEHFLWKSPEQIQALIADAGKRLKISEEIADVLIFALLLANELELNPTRAILDKLQKNSSKYPVNKAKGSATKYTEL